MYIKSYACVFASRRFIMFIAKRDNDYYYLHYKDLKGNWKAISTQSKNKVSARRFMNDFKKKRNDQPPAPIEQSTPLFEYIEFYNKYSSVNHAKANTKRIEYVLMRIKNYFSDIPLSAITVRQMEEYKAFRLQSITPTTVNIEIRTLKSFFSTAVKFNFISVNVMKDVKLLRIPERKPRYLTVEEVSQLLQYDMPPWLRRLIIFDVNTGLRRSELVNLKWDYIDMNERILRVTNDMQFNTKSKKERYVPLNETALSVLNSITKRHEYVFTKLNGFQISGNYVTQCFRDLIIQSKINKGINFHSLRHTFASWLVQKGVSIYEVSKLLGHSDIKVTEIYAHLNMNNLIKATSVLNDLNFVSP